MDRKVWNIEEFNKINLPEVIGTISDQSRFSKFKGTRVLDLPIYMPGQGWNVPDNINDYVEPIQMAINSERRFGNFLETHYVYVTIDQKIVTAGKTGRRPGAHSDAYIEVNNEQLDVVSENAAEIVKRVQEVSHTYIITDTASTEFFNAKFPIVNTTCKDALETFDEIANKSEIVTYPEYTLLRLDPFVIHRSSIIDNTTERTFMKIAFSRKKYARKGNTINSRFKYDWEMTARSPSNRNHPW